MTHSPNDQRQDLLNGLAALIPWQNAWVINALIEAHIKEALKNPGEYIDWRDGERRREVNGVVVYRSYEDYVG